MNTISPVVGNRDFSSSSRAYKEFFAGYEVDPVALLERAFEKTDSRDNPETRRELLTMVHSC